MIGDNSRRRVLRLAGLTIASSLSGCAGIVGQTETATPNAAQRQATEQDGTATTPESKIRKPTGALKRVTVPKSPSDYPYAVMGSADAPVTATVYGSWKCPYTQKFVVGYLYTLIEEFVQPGDVLIEFREVAYRDGEPFHGPEELTAAHAGLSIWTHAPEAFWQYFAYLFVNQGTSVTSWTSADRILELARHADVSGIETVRNDIQAKKYETELENTMKNVRERGINAVPRVVVQESVTAPAVNPRETRKQFEKALANS